ncbi:MAG: hypothetical protein DI537_02385 [Stutzerimonas stutzeri]|nr:MAG: hypothetical protein DI537_02385 [Stutzerimonas stutzeri]
MSIDSSTPSNLRATSTRAAALGSTAMPVFLFQSGKGGVAKSSEALKLNYHFIREGRLPTLIDGDRTVQDIILAHKDEQDCHPIALSDEDGFTEFADVIASTDAASPIIASLPGGQLETFSEYAEVIQIAARNAGRKAIVISPMDRYVNSYSHVPEVEKAMPGTEIYLVRPLWFGRPDQFVAFNASQIGKRYLAADRVIDAPLMPAALARAFKDGKRSLHWVEVNGSGGEQATLETWREKSRRAYARFLG